MRNFKKFLALMMAVLMVVGMSVIPMGAANTAADYTEAAQQLSAIGIMKGDENGNLMLDQGVTRYQAALFFVQSITGKTDPSVWNADKSAIFTDVPEYGTAIDYLAGIGLIVGRGNGIYGYNDQITYQDMLVLAVRALGYETKDMSYPYGHILEAQKLGLTDNIDSVNFKETMTRGETAQLIWDMLNTQIAITDPLTGEIVYPGMEDSSPYGLILGPGKIKRETYLEKSGFAAGKLEISIVEFKKAANSDGIDTVVVEYNGEQHEMAAADLGIKADTPKIDYLGLRATIMVNSEADKFFDLYSVEAEESEARVVFTNWDALTQVENLGDAGAIKYVVPTTGEPYLLIGGVKFATDKYTVNVYEFGDAGWELNEDSDFLDNFKFTTKDGYIGSNSNGAVKYMASEVKKDGGDAEKIVSVYYTPYEFGQYFVRTLKDSTTAKDAEFVTIGSYEESKVENKDKVQSNFVEYLLGTTSKVTSATTSVSKRNGEKAKSVKLAGEGVKSGDFMFYYYNSVDNILTVASSHGGFKTGALTGTSLSAETVKIGGSNKHFGFKGAYETTYSNYTDNASMIQTIIKNYESGKDNVKYVEVDGRIVYMDQYSGESISSSAYDFKIVSIDPERIAKLMKVDVEDLEYTADFVLDEDGNVRIAVLNTETGEWELAALDVIAKDYNADDDIFGTKGSLGVYATYVEIAGESYTKYEEYRELAEVLEDGRLFAVVSEKDGVYNLGAAEDAVQYATIAEGLLFSDVSHKTNPIKADPDATAARVTLNENSMIVVIDGQGNIGVRTGIQKDKYSISGSADVYAATSDLIVAVIESPTFTGGFSTVEDWGESRAAASDATYYVATGDSELFVESSGEDVKEKYTITITNLLDLRTLQIVESKSFGSNTVIDLDLSKALYANEDGVITESDKSIAEAFAEARKLEAAEQDITFTDIAASDLTFIDGETVKIAGDTIKLPNALAGVNATILTLNSTGFSADDYDFDRLALNTEYDGSLDATELEIREGFSGYEYLLGGDRVEVIEEPVAGVLNQFILDTEGDEILLPVAGSDDYEGAESIMTELKIMASYDEDTGILTLFVAKILVPYAMG